MKANSLNSKSRRELAAKKLLLHVLDFAFSNVEHQNSLVDFLKRWLTESKSDHSDNIDSNIKQTIEQVARENFVHELLLFIRNQTIGNIASITTPTPPSTPITSPSSLLSTPKSNEIKQASKHSRSGSQAKTQSFNFVDRDFPPLHSPPGASPARRKLDFEASSPAPTSGTSSNKNITVLSQPSNPSSGPVQVLQVRRIPKGNSANNNTKPTTTSSKPLSQSQWPALSPTPKHPEQTNSSTTSLPPKEPSKPKSDPVTPDQTKQKDSTTPKSSNQLVSPRNSESTNQILSPKNTESTNQTATLPAENKGKVEKPKQAKPEQKTPKQHETQESTAINSSTHLNTENVPPTNIQTTPAVKKEVLFETKVIVNPITTLPDTTQNLSSVDWIVDLYTFVVLHKTFVYLSRELYFLIRLITSITIQDINEVRTSLPAPTTTNPSDTKEADKKEPEKAPEATIPPIELPKPTTEDPSPLLSSPEAPQFQPGSSSPPDSSSKRSKRKGRHAKKNAARAAAKAQTPTSSQSESSNNASNESSPTDSATTTPAVTPTTPAPPTESAPSEPAKVVDAVPPPVVVQPATPPIVRAETGDFAGFPIFFFNKEYSAYFAAKCLEKLSPVLFSKTSMKSSYVKLLKTNPIIQIYAPQLHKMLLEKHATRAASQDGGQPPSTPVQEGAPKDGQPTTAETEEDEPRSPKGLTSNPNTPLSSPFRAHVDSRNNFKGNEEQQLYNNREKCRDLFFQLIHDYGNVLGTAEVMSDFKRDQSMADRIRLMLNMLLSPNYGWFAELFMNQLLQCNLNQYSENDPSLTKLANPEKLRKLSQRFSGSALGESPQYDIFFYKIVEIGNNFCLNMHLMKECSHKMVLFRGQLSHSAGSTQTESADSQQAPRNVQTPSRSDQSSANLPESLMQLKALAKGYLVSLPYSRKFFGTISSSAAEASKKEDVIIQQGWDNIIDIPTLLNEGVLSKSLCITVPWTLEFLKSIAQENIVLWYALKFQSADISSKTEFYAKCLNLLKCIYNLPSMQPTSPHFNVNSLYILCELEEYFEANQVNPFKYTKVNSWFDANSSETTPEEQPHDFASVQEATAPKSTSSKLGPPALDSKHGLVNDKFVTYCWHFCSELSTMLDRAQSQVIATASQPIAPLPASESQAAPPTAPPTEAQPAPQPSSELLSPHNPTANLKPMKKITPVVDENASQKQLRQWFFWQYPELKTLSEFVCDRVIANATIMAVNFINEFIERRVSIFTSTYHNMDEATLAEETAPEKLTQLFTKLHGDIHREAVAHVKPYTKENIKNSIALMATIDLHASVITTATALTVEHAYDVISTVIDDKLKVGLKNKLERFFNALKKKNSKSQQAANDELSESEPDEPILPSPKKKTTSSKSPKIKNPLHLLISPLAHLERIVLQELILEVPSKEVFDRATNDISICFAQTYQQLAKCLKKQKELTENNNNEARMLPPEMLSKFGMIFNFIMDISFYLFVSYAYHVHDNNTNSTIITLHFWNQEECEQHSILLQNPELQSSTKYEDLFYTLMGIFQLLAETDIALFRKLPYYYLYHSKLFSVYHILCNDGSTKFSAFCGFISTLFAILAEKKLVEIHLIEKLCKSTLAESDQHKEQLIKDSPNDLKAIQNRFGIYEAQIMDMMLSIAQKHHQAMKDTKEYDNVAFTQLLGKLWMHSHGKNDESQKPIQEFRSKLKEYLTSREGFGVG